jgi:ubiquinone/menaquinone biosynthesis C-methylase UbiE
MIVNQSEMSDINQAAWNTSAYEAWVIENGTPLELAAKLEPEKVLKRVLKTLGDLNGKKVANPLGSRGKAAVAMALLGADVTIFDLSESSKRYALELASAANVKLEYVAGDFMRLETQNYDFDLVLMELGILHWFMDLNALAKQIRDILKTGGRLVLNDFHPIASKLLSKTETQTLADRDYFDSSPHLGKVPYQDLIAIETPDCITRRWTLGEIVTAFAQNGFQIQTLEETPGWGFNANIPGLFTLVATAT